MAEEMPGGALEQGAEMDYREHEKTYNFFLEFAKYSTLFCIAIVISMAFGFFAGGWFSACILFVLLMAVGAFFLR